MNLDELSNALSGTALIFFVIAVILMCLGMRWATVVASVAFGIAFIAVMTLLWLPVMM